MWFNTGGVSVMRAKPVQRAKIRLRLDRGTALLKHLKLEPIACELMDISEGGCQGRILLNQVSTEAAESWQALLVPGRILTLEVTEPGELKGFTAPEAEIRWVKTPKPGEVVFGVLLRGLTTDQTQLLNQTLVAVATKKLGKKGATPLPQPRPLVPPAPPPPRAVVPPPPPPPPRAAVPAPPPPPPPRPQTARGRSTFEPTEPPARSGASLTRTPAVPEPTPLTPKREFHPPIAGTAGAQSRSGQMLDFERQKRFVAGFEIVLHFCDAQDRKVDPELHEGRVIDFNEGGFMIEAPAPSGGDPLQLQGSGRMLATVQLPNHEVACKLEILSVKPNGAAWRYGVRILEMPEEDRARLRELYIRESLTTITRKRR
jgi:hypothetical protein